MAKTFVFKYIFLCAKELLFDGLKTQIETTGCTGKRKHSASTIRAGIHSHTGISQITENGI